MRHTVLLTAGAERDLQAIHDYIVETDELTAADRLLRRLLETGTRLAENPERGSRPRELLALGIREYRQILVKPYRLVYRVAGRQVYIMVIADGRRDMQSLLARHLLAID